MVSGRLEPVSGKLAGETGENERLRVARDFGRIVSAVARMLAFDPAAAAAVGVQLTDFLDRKRSGAIARNQSSPTLGRNSFLIPLYGLTLLERVFLSHYVPSFVENSI
jgi:hypothetical protein